MTPLQHLIRNHEGFAFLFLFGGLMCLMMLAGESEYEIDKSSELEISRNTVKQGFIAIGLEDGDKYFWSILSCLCFGIGITRLVLSKKYTKEKKGLEEGKLTTKKMIGEVREIVPVYHNLFDKEGMITGWYVRVYAEGQTYESDITGIPTKQTDIKDVFKANFKLYENAIETLEAFNEYMKNIVKIGDKYTISISLDNPDMYSLEPIKQPHRKNKEKTKDDTKPHQPTLNERLEQEGKDLSIETQTIYKQLYPNKKKSFSFVIPLFLHKHDDKNLQKRKIGLYLSIF